MIFPYATLRSRHINFFKKCTIKKNSFTSIQCHSTLKCTSNVIMFRRESYDETCANLDTINTFLLRESFNKSYFVTIIFSFRIFLDMFFGLKYWLTINCFKSFGRSAKSQTSSCCIGLNSSSIWFTYHFLSWNSFVTVIGSFTCLML